MDEKSDKPVEIENVTSETSIQVDELEINPPKEESTGEVAQWEQLDAKLQRLMELQEKLLLNLSKQPEQKQPEQKQPEQKQEQTPLPLQSEQVKVTLADNQSSGGGVVREKTVTRKPRKRSLKRNKK